MMSLNEEESTGWADACSRKSFRWWRHCWRSVCCRWVTEREGSHSDGDEEAEGFDEGMGDGVDMEVNVAVKVARRRWMFPGSESEGAD